MVKKRKRQVQARPAFHKREGYKVTHRFYVGSSDIAKYVGNGVVSPWTAQTLDQAIARGKDKMEKENLDTVIIVEIVRVIRRQQQPIVVEKVIG